LVAFSQFEVAVDKLSHRRNVPPQFVQQVCYGQLEQIILMHIAPHHTIAGLESGMDLVSAAIAPIEPLKDGSSSFKRLAPTMLCDLRCVQSVVGRIYDRGTWTIVDRNGPAALSRFIDLDDDS
jgi:hypothetical protein